MYKFFSRLINKCFQRCLSVVEMGIEFIFLEKPWYLMPVRFVLYVMMIFFEIIDAQIHIFPRQFTDLDEFDKHVLIIIDKLQAYDHIDWAALLYQSLFVSQSFYEKRGELLKVLPVLKREKVAKELKLKGDINKAIKYLKSFPAT